MTAPILVLTADERRARLIKQGAEAKVYIAQLFPSPSSATEQHSSSDDVAANRILLKHRFPKTYRHPSLSSHLTAARTTAEARALVRCARAGVNVPRIVCVDEEEGVLGLELIEGASVRELLGGGSEGEDEDADEEDAKKEHVPLFSAQEASRAMSLIGVQLARMHQAHIIHGDLTTSNMMIRRRTDDKMELILIDFGLSTNSTASEDKAVDLYVLERAFASTHPSSEHLFDQIMSQYQQSLETKPVKWKAEKGTMTGPTQWKDIKRKLDDVRLRGRKRSMLG